MKPGHSTTIEYDIDQIISDIDTVILRCLDLELHSKVGDDWARIQNARELLRTAIDIIRPEYRCGCDNCVSYYKAVDELLGTDWWGVNARSRTSEL